MAIQISGTTVIDNSRNFTNLGTGSFSGTVTASTPTASGHAAIKSYVDGLIGGGGAGAWVHWNAQGTLTINDDYNVNSITDNAGGDYTINFSNSFVDADYACSGMCGNTLNNSSGTNTQLCLKQGSTQTSSSVRITAGFDNGFGSDYPDNGWIVIR